jgi:hypothetical protein
LTGTALIRACLAFTGGLPTQSVPVCACTRNKNLKAERKSIEGILVTRKELVVIASRVIALYFIFWSLDNLSYVPLDAFALSHYSALPQEYLFKYHLAALSHHLVASAFFFVGAIWVYRCGPSVENFLSPYRS